MAADRRAADSSGSHAGNMLTALVGNGYPALVAFFTGPILAHALGVDGRGSVAAAVAPLTLIVTVATFGIPEALTFAVARNRAMARSAAARAALLLIGTGILAMVAMFLLIPFSSGGDAEVADLILVTCLAVVPNLLVGVLRGVASAQQRWRLVTAEKMLSSTLRLVAIVPFWLTDTLTPLIAVISVAAMPLVGSIVYFGVLRRSGEPAISLTPEASVRGLTGYGSRIWIGSISGVLLSRLDQSLMTPLTGVYELGLYVVAVSISELPLMINAAVRDITFVSDARDSRESRLAASARISSFVCLVVGLVIGVSMLWWLPLLFGEPFRPSIPVTAILLASVVLGTPGAIAGAGLSGRGRPGLRSISLVIACVANVVLLIALAPPLGAIGAALATLAGTLIASNLNLVWLQRYFGIRAIDLVGLRRSDLAVLAGFARRLLGRGR